MALMAFKAILLEGLIKLDDTWVGGSRDPAGGEGSGGACPGRITPEAGFFE